jgi:G patch domain-containing protein 2
LLCCDASNVELSVSDLFPADIASSALPIPESNLGNQMLRGMGWEPGMGLGAQSNGIQEPIVTHIRPKYVGLGHSTNYKSS